MFRRKNISNCKKLRSQRVKQMFLNVKKENKSKSKVVNNSETSHVYFI